MFITKNCSVYPGLLLKELKAYENIIESDVEQWIDTGTNQVNFHVFSNDETILNVMDVIVGAYQSSDEED